MLWLIVTISLVQGLPAESRISNAEISKASNAFALDLYARLTKEPGNIVLSPFSICTAISASSAGARGQTASQMAKVLHLPNIDTHVHAGFGALLKGLNETNASGSQLVLANALWAQQGFPVSEPFDGFFTISTPRS